MPESQYLIKTVFKYFSSQRKRLMNVRPQDPPIISIMVYYTPEFGQEFSNPLSVIKSYVAATNDAFKKSGLEEVRLKLHCIEKLSIMDNERDVAITRLKAFTNAKGTTSNLLQSADTTLLVTKSGVSTESSDQSNEWCFQADSYNFISENSGCRTRAWRSMDRTYR